MEALHSDALDRRTSEPLSLQQKTELLDSVVDHLGENKISPEQALDEASFAFNTLTDYEDDRARGIIYDSRIYRYIDIKKHQKSAEAFGSISRHVHDDARVMLSPRLDPDDNRYNLCNPTVSDYAEILSNRAKMLVEENYESFSGILADHNKDERARSPDHRNSQVLSSLLFTDQWLARGYDATSKTDVLETLPEVDIPQITLLCRLQADLDETFERHRGDFSDKEALRKKLATIHQTLESSPELSTERIKDFPAAIATKHLIHAATLQTLGELSLDGNPKDFQEIREHCMEFAADESPTSDEKLTRKSTFEVSTALAVKQLRTAENEIDNSNLKPSVDLSSIRNAIRHDHDAFSAKIGLPKVDFTGAPLRELPQINLAEFVKTIPREIGSTATNKAQQELAQLSSEHDDSQTV